MQVMGALSGAGYAKIGLITEQAAHAGIPVSSCSTGFTVSHHRPCRTDRSRRSSASALRRPIDASPVESIAVDLGADQRVLQYPHGRAGQRRWSRPRAPSIVEFRDSRPNWRSPPATPRKTSRPRPTMPDDAGPTEHTAPAPRRAPRASARTRAVAPEPTRSRRPRRRARTEPARRAGPRAGRADAGARADPVACPSRPRSGRSAPTPTHADRLDQKRAAFKSSSRKQPRRAKPRKSAERRAAKKKAEEEKKRKAAEEQKRIEQAKAERSRQAVADELANAATSTTRNRAARPPGEGEPTARRKEGRSATLAAPIPRDRRAGRADPLVHHRCRPAPRTSDARAELHIHRSVPMVWSRDGHKCSALRPPDRRRLCAGRVRALRRCGPFTRSAAGQDRPSPIRGAHLRVACQKDDEGDEVCLITRRNALKLGLAGAAWRCATNPLAGAGRDRRDRRQFHAAADRHSRFRLVRPAPSAPKSPRSCATTCAAPASSCRSIRRRLPIRVGDVHERARFRRLARRQCRCAGDGSGRARRAR